MIGGVLCPHVLERWKNDSTPMIVHLKAAHNGVEPDESAPPLPGFDYARRPR